MFGMCYCYACYAHMASQLVVLLPNDTPLLLIWWFGAVDCALCMRVEFAINVILHLWAHFEHWTDLRIRYGMATWLWLSILVHLFACCTRNIVDGCFRFEIWTCCFITVRNLQLQRSSRQPSCTSFSIKAVQKNDTHS